MSVVIWAGLRQIEAVRNSFFLSLTQGSAVSAMNSDDVDKLKEWIYREGLGDWWERLNGLENLSVPQSSEELPDIPRENVIRFDALWGTATTLCHSDSARVIGEGTRTTDQISPENDFGVERSSASWSRWENFVTTSAMLRFLGAWEKFEMDALKCLLFYRPLGMGAPASEFPDETAGENVVCEVPVKRSDGKKTYALPAMWTWIRSSAENNTERKRIFSQVYGIDLDRPDKKDFGWTYDELYDMRNAIAHGRDAVEITVGELLKVHNYVIKSMLSTVDKVFDRYRVRL